MSSRIVPAESGGKSSIYPELRQFWHEFGGNLLICLPKLQLPTNDGVEVIHLGFGVFFVQRQSWIFTMLTDGAVCLDLRMRSKRFQCHIEAKIKSIAAITAVTTTTIRFERLSVAECCDLETKREDEPDERAGRCFFEIFGKAGSDERLSLI